MGDDGSKGTYMSEWVTSLLAGVFEVLANRLGTLRSEPPGDVSMVCEYGKVRIEVNIKFEVIDG